MHAGVRRPSRHPPCRGERRTSSTTRERNTARRGVPHAGWLNTSCLYPVPRARGSSTSRPRAARRAGSRGVHHDKLIKKVTLLDKQKRFLSCNSSKGCPKGVTPLLVTGAAHVGRQDVGLCARDCGVPSRSVARWSPAWRRTRASTLREKMVSKSRWNRFRDAVVPPPTACGAPRV